MNRTCYTLLYYCLLPFIFARLLWRSIKSPEYRKRWAERLGCHTTTPKTGGIWIHAVSVGEVIAAEPLIRIIKSHYPELDLTVTTMTPTGSERVTALLGNEVFHQYVPYDTPCALKRFLGRIKPKLLIIMETELWPNMINQCHANKIPVVLANARLSDRSAKGYGRLPKLIKPMLNQINMIVAQGVDDGQRFISLGLPEDNLKVVGSIKFDINIDENIHLKAKALTNSWGAKRPVLVAGSTHNGEDELLLVAYKKLLRQFPELLLILVPRHPERFNKVAKLVLEHNLIMIRRSTNEPVNNTTNILLGDTIGELMLFYATATVAFVGGTLVERGGHNFLEPAALSVPIISGKHVFNFSDISKLLVSKGAMLQVNNIELLADKLTLILQDKTIQHRMGNAGFEVVKQNRGALLELYKVITKFL